LIARIDEALSSVDLQHPSRGVAILVSDNMTRVIALDTPVGPQVVVGKRFAIWDLVAAMSRAKRARVLVLSLEKTRCIELDGEEVVERGDFGFPVEVVPPVEADAPHRDFPLSEHERSEAPKFVFRAVDHALNALEHHDRLPLVIVGATRDLAYFDEVTDRHATTVGRIPGNYERSSPEEIAHLVLPTLERHAEHERQRVCDEAREAIGTHAVAGITEAWLAARAGRGNQLVVEDGYRYPAHVVAERLELASDPETGPFEAVADTVEAVVRHGGEVVVVSPGSLADLGHIALLTRY
jgi:Bacterial archaeo-eukaryotic release factor family 3